ncbi:SDR family oxidoreductase [Amylibacter sp. SFDW26]|uniref:SDR family oxidoreductase n=1 Tax=Amylibacter sp. SFDW26 TaxID=2652722 RepID=UPI001262AC0D|nr:SDR family oxidoreductase [Amylibacter sp. SFDW26]KAB7613370.1 SDR family oxidoreductase [Amylibacter sp. SFDW26]
MSPTDKRNRPVILITGASSGLGAGMAKEFAKRGYDLALSARRIEQVNELKADIEKIAPEARIETARLDVTEYASVFDVFNEFRNSFGKIDRIIINAGIGKGAPIGKGAFETNLTLMNTNLIAAMAQSEAAMEIFRDQNEGHLVMMSSITAMRGMRSAMTAYATSKAAVSALAEGIRADMLRKPKINVSTIYPGYISTEINQGLPKSKTPFIIDAEKGCKLLVKAIERKPAKAYVPYWPWALIGFLMRTLPLSWVSRII